MRKLKITELNRISAEEFKKADKLPLVVILDDIRSLHNIGSVFRTSDAFRIECIYLMLLITSEKRDISFIRWNKLKEVSCSMN